MAGNYLNEARFDEIRKAMDSGNSLAQQAVKQLFEKADKALELEPLNVRQNLGSPYFIVDGAYVPDKDGIRNTEANHVARNLAKEFSEAVLDLALAWRVTRENRYAEKALELIHCWCINQNTRMFATGFVYDAATPGAVYGGDVVMFHCFLPSFIAMYLLDSYENWDLESRAAVRQWVRDMVEPQRKLMFFGGKSMYNNWEDARLLYLACGAIFLSDLDLLLEVAERWQKIIPLKMTDQGQLPRETMRTRSLHYTLFALDSTTMAAKILQGYNCDLFSYEIAGKSLKLAIDYVTKHMLDLDNWPFERIHPIEYEQGLFTMETFEIAYAQWGDEKYLKVLEQYGPRPSLNSHATLMFANF